MARHALLIESGSVLTHLHCLINWEAWTAIGTVSLAVIAGVTALYAKQQLNDFRRESRIAHLISLVDQFEREPMAGTRRALGSKRAPGGVLVPLVVPVARIFGRNYWITYTDAADKVNRSETTDATALSPVSRLLAFLRHPIPSTDTKVSPIPSSNCLSPGLLV